MGDGQDLFFMICLNIQEYYKPLSSKAASYEALETCSSFKEN